MSYAIWNQREGIDMSDMSFVKRHDLSEVDWDAEEREYEKYLQTPDGKKVVQGGSTTTLLKAVGGPFDGEMINVPPGGTEVSMPSAFGQGDLVGSSIYRRAVNLADASTYMEYVGQSVHEDPPDEEYVAGR